MPELHPGCVVVQSAKHGLPDTMSRVVAMDEAMGEVVVVKFPKQLKHGRCSSYVPAPRRESLAALRRGIADDKLRVLEFQAPSYQLLLPSQIEANDSSDLTRRTRRHLPMWYAKADERYEDIRPFVEGRTIEEIVFDERLPGWPSRRAQELGNKSPVTIANSLNTYILGMGFKSFLVPRYAYSGGPGKRKVSKRKTGRPSEAAIAYGASCAGENCDERVRKIFAMGWKRFKKPEVSALTALDKTLNAYMSDRVEYDGAKAVVLLSAEAHKYTLRQFKYWGQKADEVLHEVAQKLSISPQSRQRAARMETRKGRVRSYNAEAFLDSTSADQTLVSAASQLKIIGSPDRTTVMDGVVNYIFGVHLGFESVSATTALMTILNAAEDKVAFCARYGRHIEPEDWLSSTFLLHPMDNGEGKGKEVLDWLEHQEGGASFGPAYDALNKSPQESNHQAIHRRLDHLLPGSTMGRRKRRGEADRSEFARLDFFTYMGILIDKIYIHNNVQRIELPTLEMHKAGVEPTRRGVILWMRENGYVSSAPRDLEQLRIRCLPALNGVIDQDGVHLFDPTHSPDRRISDLVYRSEWLNRNVLGSFRKTRKIKAHVNPSDLSKIWVNIEGLRELCLITNDPDLNNVTLLDWLMVQRDGRLEGYLHRAVEVQHRVNLLETVNRATARGQKARNAELRAMQEATGKKPSKTSIKRDKLTNRSIETAALTGVPKVSKRVRAEAQQPVPAPVVSPANAPAEVSATLDPFEVIVQNAA